MRKISYRPYFLLVFFFLCVMSLSYRTTEKMRSLVICSFSPCWKGISSLKQNALFFLTGPAAFSSDSSDMSLEYEKLAQENQLLRSQVESVREWLLNEDRIQEQLTRLKALNPQAATDPEWKGFLTRRSEELCRALDLQIRSLPARVIFREPASWSSSLWINLGEKDNIALGKKAIGKYSPVLVGSSIVGVIEQVEKNRSRVRLITDNRLNPSVRVIRGKEQNKFLLEHIDSLLFALELREDLFPTLESALEMEKQLVSLKSALEQQSEELYLAKGELRGSSQPLWRSRGQTLKGVGFNYDFSDREGPSRDLRSGLPYGTNSRSVLIALLRPGDLLVTTGLDGVFPPGFRIAQITKVETLKEGASSYELEAMPTAGDLNDLQFVFVLPPLDAANP